MKLISENIEDLRSLYVGELKKALDMEQKITKALPKMIEKSTDSQLTTGVSQSPGRDTAMRQMVVRHFN